MHKRIRGLPAIVRFSNQSSWVSSNTISANLFRAYQLAFSRRINCFEISRAMKPEDVARVAKQIHSSRPDRIIFIEDHFPHPGPLLSALEAVYGSKCPPLYVHV